MQHNPFIYIYILQSLHFSGGKENPAKSRAMSPFRRGHEREAVFLKGPIIAHYLRYGRKSAELEGNVCFLKHPSKMKALQTHATN